MWKSTPSPSSRTRQENIVSVVIDQLHGSVKDVVAAKILENSNAEEKRRREASGDQNRVCKSEKDTSQLCSVNVSLQADKITLVMFH